MASVKRNTDSTGKVTWQALWRDPAGTSRKATFPKKTAAERHLVGIENDKLRGAYVDPARSRVTVGDWSEQWLAGQAHLKESTRARYTGIVTKHVVPRWGRAPLAAVTHAEVTRWIAELSASGLAPATVRYVHRVFFMALELAVRDGRIARNPAAGVRLPRAGRPEKRFLTHEQVFALAEAAGPHRVLILTLAYCGLRWGELAALRVRGVDPLRRRLVIAEAVTEVGGQLVWGTPKDHQCREVPLPRFLANALAQHVAGRGPQDLVFTTARGAVLRNLNFRRDAFDRAATQAGLDGLTPHELRHTAAALAISAGANVKAVQRMLGHASAAMTLDVYAGLFDADLDGVADRLGLAHDSLAPLVRPQAKITDLAERRTGR